MMYVGIDFHKKYSVASSVDENGQIGKESRIDGKTQGQVFTLAYETVASSQKPATGEMQRAG